ncbi:MAG: hypothetical protein AB2L11_06250 [Syntrophobacteraceae bacterium]
MTELKKEGQELLDMFCIAIQMKEKKKALYEEAMKTCPDQVGIETFRILEEAENEHIQRIRSLYEQLKDGKDAVADNCRFFSIEGEEQKKVLLRIAEEHGKVPKACVDDVVAIESGMKLENASIVFFQKTLEQSKDKVEHEFLETMITEEREHFMLLADLKFYYTDPESWFLEKSRAGLDGAGASS